MDANKSNIFGEFSSFIKKKNFSKKAVREVRLREDLRIDCDIPREIIPVDWQ
jgi:hypothetical protein